MAIAGRWLAVLGLGLSVGGVRLDPEPGTRVVRTFAYESSSELEGWTVVWNGQEAPAEMLPELEIEGREEARAEVTDEVLACSDGRVRTLRRGFAGLEARDVLDVSLGGAPIEERDAPGACDLEGCVVRFEGEERVLERGDAPADSLAALELDLDFSALLAGAAAGAESWEAPAAALVPTGLPGGLAFAFEDEPEVQLGEREQWIANLEGTWRVRPLETREDGRLAVFALEGELSTRSVRATDLEHVPVVDGDATETTTTTWKATGELVWDVERRTLRSLEVAADVRSTVVTVRDLLGVPGEPTYEQTLRLTGTSKLRCDVRTP
jgi:hypothetical protein